MRWSHELSSPAIKDIFLIVINVDGRQRYKYLYVQTVWWGPGDEHSHTDVSQWVPQISKTNTANKSVKSISYVFPKKRIHFLIPVQSFSNDLLIKCSKLFSSLEHKCSENYCHSPVVVVACVVVRGQKLYLTQPLFLKFGCHQWTMLSSDNSCLYNLFFQKMNIMKYVY